MQVPPQPDDLPMRPRIAARTPSVPSQPDLSVGADFMAHASATGAPRPDRPGALQRLWGGWLWLVAPPLRRLDANSPFARALQRRRALASALLLGLLLLWTLLSGVSVTQYPQDLASALIAVAVGYLTLLAVGALIRRGWVTGAAMFLITLICAGFIAIQLSETHDALERATVFYILLYPILLAATLMPAEAIFLTLTADLFLVASTALLIWPPTIRLESISPAEFANVYAWPLTALIIISIVAYIWTSGMQRATAQAEFAQADALLSRASEANAHDALDHDVRELIRVVDAWTTGNMGAQVGQLASPDLRRVAMALSSYANRARALARDEYIFQRERELAHRLAETILYYRQGLPVTWPAPGGLPADLITRAIIAPDARAMLAELNGPTA